MTFILSCPQRAFLLHLCSHWSSVYETPGTGCLVTNHILESLSTAGTPSLSHFSMQAGPEPLSTRDCPSHSLSPVQPLIISVISLIFFISTENSQPLLHYWFILAPILFLLSFWILDSFLHDVRIPHTVLSASSKAVEGHSTHVEAIRTFRQLTPSRYPSSMGEQASLGKCSSLPVLWWDILQSFSEGPQQDGAHRSK